MHTDQWNSCTDLRKGGAPTHPIVDISVRLSSLERRDDQLANSSVFSKVWAVVGAYLHHCTDLLLAQLHLQIDQLINLTENVLFWYFCSVAIVEQFADWRRWQVELIDLCLHTQLQFSVTSDYWHFESCQFRTFGKSIMKNEGVERILLEVLPLYARW